MIQELKDKLSQPEDKRWKKIADYLLYAALPAINIFFLALQPVGKEFTIWGIAISGLLISLFKGLTKFTTEPVIEPVVDEIK
jgi:hypothetical protein